MATLRCSKCKQEKPRMEVSPYPGPLSEKILSNVCADCWNAWIEASLVMLNEYRLNLLDPKHAELYDKQLLVFLGLSEGGDAPKMQLTPTTPLK